MKTKKKALTIFITLFLMIAATTTAAASYSSNLIDEYSSFEDPFLCEAIDAWQCNVTASCSCPPGGGNYPGDVWVNETGDAMTGDLNITDGTDFTNISASGINMTGSIYATQAEFFIYPGKSDEWGGLGVQAVAGSTYITAYAPTDGLDHYISFGVLDGQDFVDLVVSDDRDLRILFAGGGGTDRAIYTINTKINLGRLSERFQSLYLDKGVLMGGSDGSGLNISTGGDFFNITPFGNVHSTGNWSVHGNTVIWENGTVETGAAAGAYPGVADDWVNETGDVMSGSLNITDGTDFINLTDSGNLYMTSNLTSLGFGLFSGNVYDNTNRVCTQENGLCNATFTTFYPTTNYTAEGVESGGNNIGNLSFYDSETFNITEEGGINSILFYVNFTGINTSSVNGIFMRERYKGGVGHEINFEIWDHVLDSWEGYHVITDQSGYVITSIPILDSADHLENGVVQVRFDHVQNGIGNHYLSIDFIQIYSGDTAFTNFEHDSLSGRDEPDNHPQYVKKAGDTMSGDLNISASASITGTLSVDGHLAFGATGALFNTRVLDTAENINADTSYNGIVSVLRQKVNNSGGKEILAFNYEVICDSNITCGGNMAGYRGNTRNRGWSATMRGGYVTVFNERADHNITNAVGLFAVIATRLNNIRGMITIADAVRPHFTVENGTIGNATGFRMTDTSDITASAQGRINNLWGIKTDDFNSDRLDNSWAFGFGDSINWSYIQGNYSGRQWLNQTDLFVINSLVLAANLTTQTGQTVIWSNGTVEVAGYPGVADDWVNETGDTMTGNLTITGKAQRIKGGIALVESFPDILPPSTLGAGVWGLGIGIVGNPDVPRTINVTMVSLDIGGCAGFLYINGTDAYGLYISEMITISVPGNQNVIYETDHAYGNITAVIEMAPTGGVCTYALDTTWRFGIANFPLNSAVDVYKVNVDAAHIAAAGFEVIPYYGTINLELVPGAKLNAIFWYRYGVNS